MPISTNIKSLRKKRGMTQLDLAYQAGLSINLANRLENHPVDKQWLSKLFAIAEVLGVTPLELIPDLGGVPRGYATPRQSPEDAEPAPEDTAAPEAEAPQGVPRPASCPPHPSDSRGPDDRADPVT